MAVLRFIGDLLRKFPLQLTTTTLLMVLESLAAIASMFSMVVVIDFLVDPTLRAATPVTRFTQQRLVAAGLPVTLTSLLAVFVGLQMIQNGVAIAANYWMVRTKYTVLRDLVVGTFEDLFRARWLLFTRHKQGALLNIFIHHTANVGDAFRTMALLFAALLQLVFYLTVPFYISWRVTAISMTTAVVLAAPLLWLGRVNYRLGRQNTASTNELGVAMQEGLGLAKVVLGFARQDRTMGAVRRLFDVHRRSQVLSQTLRLATPLAYEPLGMFVLAVTLLTSQRFGVSVAETAALLWALRKCIPLLGDLATRRNSLANFLPSYEQVRRLREQARDLRQPMSPTPFPGLRSELVLDRVTFAHPDHDPTLVDVNIRIPVGQRIAIVGESGSGKSTLIDIVMGFHEPRSGRVLCDGLPLSSFNLDSYRRRLGYVPQETVLFNMSIRDNLRWAREEATDEEIRRACEQAHADEFIQRLPDGYDTIVGDRGARLSGGQAQRVALARAILRQPDLLVLDEATSSLDSASERLIQNAIETLARNTTVIIVSHRLSMITGVDYLYVLENGRVVEQGTWPELQERGGVFARMAQSQGVDAVTTAPQGLS